MPISVLLHIIPNHASEEDTLPPTQAQTQRHNDTIATFTTRLNTIKMPAIKVENVERPISPPASLQDEAAKFGPAFWRGVIQKIDDMIDTLSKRDELLIKRDLLHRQIEADQAALTIKPNKKRSIHNAYLQRISKRPRYHLRSAAVERPRPRRVVIKLGGKVKFDRVLNADLPRDMPGHKAIATAEWINSQMALAERYGSE